MKPAQDSSILKEYPPPVTHPDRVKFTTQMKQMKELIRRIVIKNQEAAHRHAAHYYLMRTVAIPFTPGYGYTTHARHRQKAKR